MTLGGAVHVVAAHWTIFGPPQSAAITDPSMLLLLLLTVSILLLQSDTSGDYLKILLALVRGNWSSSLDAFWHSCAMCSMGVLDCFNNHSHRRTSQGKAIIFWATVNFSGRCQWPKMKKVFFVITKKRNSFCPARWSAQNPRLLPIIIGWCESGKTILRVSMAW